MCSLYKGLSVHLDIITLWREIKKKLYFRCCSSIIPVTPKTNSTCKIPCYFHYLRSLYHPKLLLLLSLHILQYLKNPSFNLSYTITINENLDCLLLEFCVFNIFNSIFIAINWLIIMPIARYNNGERKTGPIQSKKNKYHIKCRMYSWTFKRRRRNQWFNLMKCNWFSREKYFKTNSYEWMFLAVCTSRTSLCEYLACTSLSFGLRLLA